MSQIYADYNATTPLLNVVKDYLHTQRLHGPFANPNSLHYLGNKIHQGIEHCRHLIGEKLDVDNTRLIFTSGSSESISTAFWMSIGQEILKKTSKTHIICSEIEHAAVIEVAKYWEKQGATIHWIQCSTTGLVNIEQIEKLLIKYANSLALVAVMATNNETGILQPFEKIAELCRKHLVYYLCDTTQIIGKITIPPSLQEGVFLCGSGHKLGAPLGSGFLLLPYKDQFQAMIMGGGQEQNFRAGTQNYLGIECMTVAIEWHYKHRQTWEKIQVEKIHFESSLQKFIPTSHIIGKNCHRLPNTTLVSFKGIHSQGLQIELEARNIFVTTSAACSDNEPSTSKVLRAMGLSDEEGRSVLRVSTGLEFDINHYQQIALALKEAFQQLEKISYS